MKKQTLILAMSILAVPGLGLADNDFHDKARVLSSQPLYETVRVNQPEERCWNEQVRHRGGSRSESYTPTIAGAIVGGVVGNQFGKGKGKDAMTVAGAILGASVGNDLGKRPTRGYVTSERRCELVDHYREHEELVGYDVKYKYQGQVFHTRTDREPGRFINVRVSVVPAEGYDFREYD
ncbi:glycine zipper 2TM domain-containing protein [Sedimenticola sp.]|uniref:glycine zipper 2TM domain-containing protein n=1 Tax=Sedimenticola sp. TaxID=1940285 RepID=UPI003D10BBE0